jgi:hypothetical protein
LNKTIIAIASVCIVIAILSPIAVYAYFNNIVESYKLQIESYELQISDLKQENEKLKQENENLTELVEKPYLKEPYLITTLGWYLHHSSDPIPSSRSKFTIYGTIYNVGATIAYNCTLIVNFYNSSTVVQTSEISIGSIWPWSDRDVNTVIDCGCANSVTRIEVERFWSTYKP